MRAGRTDEASSLAVRIGCAITKVNSTELKDTDNASANLRKCGQKSMQSMESRQLATGRV